jgi:hypothetical protein
MKNLKWLNILIIATPLVLFSCKSIKKDKVLAKQENINIKRELDNSVKKQDLKLQVQENNKEVITETKEESHEVFNVNGQEVLKPVVKTTTVTEKNGVKFSEEVKTEIQEDANLKENIDSNKSKSLDLQKESEGMNVVQEIISGVFDGVLGPVGKGAIAIIFTVLTLSIVIRVIRKLKKTEENVDK